MLFIGQLLLQDLFDLETMITWLPRLTNNSYKPVRYLTTPQWFEIYMRRALFDNNWVRPDAIDVKPECKIVNFYDNIV